MAPTTIKFTLVSSAQGVVTLSSITCGELTLYAGGSTEIILGNLEFDFEVEAEVEESVHNPVVTHKVSLSRPVPNYTIKPGDDLDDD